MVWLTDVAPEGKSNDWLMQYTVMQYDRCDGRGQVKWLTNAVMQWCGDAVLLTGVVAEGKSNDWLKR